MKKLYLFLGLTIFILCSGSVSRAQLIGGNVYLPGHWLEIGQNNYGAFGAPSPGGVYHPYPAGSYLAEVYDYGHDGWTVGTPPLMGDYTYPGSPYEGWGIQVGAAGTGLNWAFTSNGAISGPGTLTGSNISYVNAGGRLLANWQGTTAGGQLKINMETRVDTNASWAVVTVFMRNLSGTPLNNIYYFRGCDPDNDEPWSFSFVTDNWVTFQNDANHRVQVSSQGQTYTTNAYMALSTKDCRAKALVYNSWPIDFYVTDLSTVYTGTAAITPTYAVGNHVINDIGIGIVYNIGTIAANDSAVISYAYVFKNINAIDSAFADPLLTVNGVPIAPSGAAPAPTIDTFNSCLYPGMTTLPVNILNATDKDWTWSTWTWAPATGLASTTGVNNTVDLTAIPAIITYTITGNDSASNMKSCNHRVMYLTVKTCRLCVNNSPCAGDTLKWNLKGDSTGATYVWYGPAPSTAIFSTLQAPWRYPATYADSGMYHCVRTTAGVHDTDSTRVLIRPKPNISVTSNSPLCLGAIDTLKLFSTTDVTPVTYAWSGPPAFTSTLANPTRPGVATTDTGWYSLVVTTTFGCKDTDKVHVILAPPPAPPIVTDPSPYCQNDPFVPFSITGVTGTVYWFTTATGGAGSTTTPTVNTAVPGTYKFYFSQRIGVCESIRDSITIIVNPIPLPITGTTVICQYFTTTLIETTTGGAWSSSAPAVATVGTSGIVTGVAGGTATIIYTLPTTCKNSTVVTINPKPAAPAVTTHYICQYTPASSAITPTGPGILWYGEGLPASGITVPAPPPTDSVRVFTYHLTQTSPFGCVSDSSALTVIIVPEPAPPVTHDTGYCEFTPNIPHLTADSAAGSHLLWYTSGAGGAPLGTVPFPANTPYTWPTGTTWYVSQTVNSCESHRAPLTITIWPHPDFIITRSSDWLCQHDSINMSYAGPAYPGIDYTWVLPYGASFVNGSGLHDGAVSVKFDSSSASDYVYLTTTNFNKTCRATDTVRIKVVKEPVAQTYCKPDLCVGDTLKLALSYMTASAQVYAWYIDGTALASTHAAHIVSANSNSGGPFDLEWVDSGRHIIKLTATSVEGCKSKPFYDTINAHPQPDATFTAVPDPKRPTICIEDSILFLATDKNYGDSYKWEPEQFFNNNNKPAIYGKVERDNSEITLTVTTPFGCKNSASLTINPEACCKVIFPTAFTPNGDSRNNTFRPLFQGYHKFHSFRIVNRWGQTVFECANNNPAWDGNFNGAPQDMGVYYFFVKYDCGGQTIEEKGDVTLVR